MMKKNFLKRFKRKGEENYWFAIFVLLMDGLYYDDAFFDATLMGSVMFIFCWMLWDLSHTKDLNNALANWTLVAMVAQGVNLGHAVFLVVRPPSDAVVGTLWVSVIGYSALLIATAVLFIRLWNRTKDTGAYLEPAEDSPEH